MGEGETETSTGDEERKKELSGTASRFVTWKSGRRMVGSPQEW
jgi:hypothetical protein